MGRRPNFIYERRLEFLGSCLPRLKGRQGLGPPTTQGLLGFTKDDPERRRLPPWWRTGKKLARDPCYSATYPKGQRSPEHFREYTGAAGVCTSLPKCRNTASKLDTRTGPGPCEAEAARRGAVWGVLEGVSPPTCLLWSRWPYPAAPFAPLLTLRKAGVFIGKLCDSRALRRVVVEPFQERKSAGSPPKVSKPPWGPSCSSFRAFLGHFAGPPCLRPPWP